MNVPDPGDTSLLAPSIRMNWRNGHEDESFLDLRFPGNEPLAKETDAIEVLAMTLFLLGTRDGMFPIAGLTFSQDEIFAMSTAELLGEIRLM